MLESKDKQKEIYEFLKTYTENKGYPQFRWNLLLLFMDI